MTTADVKLAVVFENVLFDLASIGLLVAKASLISFLMRLVPQHHGPVRWRVMIIGPLVVLGVVSFGSVMAYWARCFGELDGRDLLCDSIEPAMRWMQVAAGCSVAVDLWYAALPWYLLRRLSRPRREKILIQGSMSLGVLAAGCGIARALAIYPAMNNLDDESGTLKIKSPPPTPPPPKKKNRRRPFLLILLLDRDTDTCPTAAILYLWHGAEMAVSMICIGMPVCRPAVASMLSVLGLTIHDLTGVGAGGGDGHGGAGGGFCSKDGARPSYIRNFSKGTWEEAVNAHDVDNWSQRRILGVGGATSGVVGGGRLSPHGDHSPHHHHGSGSGSGSSFAKEPKGGGGGTGDEEEEIGGLEVVGYPMRTMSKSGITVTRTVDVMSGRKNSR